jgi:hypothetical protein
MTLDASTRRNLELDETLRGERKGSLLGTLDLTITPMGKRLMHQWVSQPLLNVEKIKTPKRRGIFRSKRHEARGVAQCAETARRLGTAGQPRHGRAGTAARPGRNARARWRTLPKEIEVAGRTSVAPQMVTFAKSNCPCCKTPWTTTRLPHFAKHGHHPRGIFAGTGFGSSTPPNMPATGSPTWKRSNAKRQASRHSRLATTRSSATTSKSHAARRIKPPSITSASRRWSMPSGSSRRR